MKHLHLPAALAQPDAATAARSEPIMPRGLSRNIAVALVVIVLIGVARTTPPLSGAREVVAWLAALTFAVAFPLTTLRPQAALTALCGLCGVAMQAMLLGSTALLMVFVAMVQSSRFEAPVGPGIALATGLSYEIAAIVAVRSIDPGSVLSSASGLIFAYLAASNFRRLREEKRKTEALLHEALAGRDAQIRAATLDERTRIAREIHDILAHTLSALAVQLEGTHMLVEQRPGDPAALSALDRASRLARDGLEETKRAVGALRGDALPGPEELTRLADSFRDDTGIACRLSVEGEPIDLSPEARLALYRTAQEALTNVRKHATATAVVMTLRYDTHAAELTVENDGAARPAELAGGSYGLSGMRERAELAHGTLEAGPTPSGFRVRLWLPT